MSLGGMRRAFVAALAVAVVAAGVTVWLLRDRGHPSDPVTSQAPRTPTVIATITVGGELTGAGIDPTAGTLYVASSQPPEAGHIAVIDTTTRSVANTFDVGLPLGVAVDPTTHTIYATGSIWGPNPGVSVIDATTGAIEATIDAIGEIAVDPAGARAYVVDGGDHVAAQVSVIDLTSNTVVASTKIGAEGPATVAVDPGAHAAYCADWAGLVSVVDRAGVVTGTFDIGSGPSAMTVDPSGRTLYVSHSKGYYDPGTLSVIDLATRALTATIDVGKLPGSIAVDPTNHLAYVTNSYDGTVSVIDTTADTVTATVKVGTRPDAVVVDPDSHLAYIANGGDGTVSVISSAPQD